MYIADLHIHSRYSRATSTKGVPEYLELWARKKGIGLLGTGDFTHPAWRAELADKLEPAEDGLYRLRDSVRLSENTAGEDDRPRFVISGEISSIYKKNGKVRKVHNVILLPSPEKANVLSRKLETIGNIHSDGRPILGLDSRDLLEITLESCPEAIFIPAHIWTPHFSLFGAFSGFDTIAECFGDLTPHIHALETGLSSDPAMNWRLSALDGYCLVSNSDAHSPNKLGREANLLDTALSYAALRQAIETGEGFAGTIEFFPEEGKYHLDGHRKCGVCLMPSETIAYDGKCPVCGKKITVGVSHRVEELADRPEGYRPENPAHFESLVPLQEVIAASTGISAAGKKAEAQYEAMLAALGPEFYILREAPIEDIRRVMGPCVAEGIRRLRAGQVDRTPGYDGEYGKISLLSSADIESLNGQFCLFAEEADAPANTKKGPAKSVKKQKNGEEQPSASILTDLNAEQKKAVEAKNAVVAVIAGPGTGKTKTLIARIADLIENQGADPGEITAVTFTNQAAGELRERLREHFGSKKIAGQFCIGTFHSICLTMLAEKKKKPALIDSCTAAEFAQAVIDDMGISVNARKFLQAVSVKKNGQALRDIPETAFTAYQERLARNQLLDFDDLLLAGLEIAKTPDRRFTHILVDEFQDMNAVQLRLVQAWHQSGKSLFAIGDPDQSIYGFRGADGECFQKLCKLYPTLQEIRLEKNYRSVPAVLGCALPLISNNPGAQRKLEPQRRESGAAVLYQAESDLSEGIFIAKEINKIVGGMDMLDAQDLGAQTENPRAFGFADIAVLYRTHRQARLLESCLQKEGIPYIVTGREELLEDAVVRGTIAFFRSLLNPADQQSCRLCLETIFHCPPDITEAVLQGRPDTWIRKTPHLQLWNVLRQEFIPKIKKERPMKILEDWQSRDGIPVSEGISRLINIAVFYPDMRSFLDNLLLGTESDISRSGGSYTGEAVRLMTFHGAKGLEFPVVFLSGMKQGCIPLEAGKYPVNLEEERRLLYVGMTRAREQLIMVCGKQDPSPFLKEIPRKAYTLYMDRRKKIPAGKQMSLFD